MRKEPEVHRVLPDRKIEWQGRTLGEARDGIVHTSRYDDMPECVVEWILEQGYGICIYR